MKNVKFYICPHCGNLAQMIHDAGTNLVCCGQKMDELVGGKSKYKKGGFRGSRPLLSIWVKFLQWYPQSHGTGYAGAGERRFRRGSPWGAERKR